MVCSVLSDLHQQFLAVNQSIQIKKVKTNISKPSVWTSSSCITTIGISLASSINICFCTICSSSCGGSSFSLFS
ncbi:unnamed protein product [Haemonchus placei]|uniref:Ovule protein n=1 Tax=Haemonchus placei TaxID=6290 RepID=A0A0N4WQK9_HAEPC|nr:unnamed protein product [Haemonchus placei]